MNKTLKTSNLLVHTTHEKSNRGIRILTTNTSGDKTYEFGEGWFYSHSSLREYAKWLTEIADELDPPKVEEYESGFHISGQFFGKSGDSDAVLFMYRGDDSKLRKLDEQQTEDAIRHMQNLLQGYRQKKQSKQADKAKAAELELAQNRIEKAVELLGVDAAKELIE